MCASSGRRWLRTLHFEGPGLASAQQVEHGAGVRDAAVDAERRVETRAHVAHLLQLAPHFALPQALGVQRRRDGYRNG